ncbi:class I SAM-dependent methyltransferase [Kutzneria sp. CA-103260]|uniref:class I SAM-dependent methyltransferase n=1 Tax=Kutzneria sp. CA-103260 TaxID=2802641 RepID=UPI001BAAC089|nr:class I SAM-dependent methyltransferase [Kutzneria sp. CA-103260]QUQ66912.1 Ribosomal RNA small subunit methyltransferase A [Kutzneria sp. CA-103260]
MPMNFMHRRICSSQDWARQVREQKLPWSLAGVELGEDLLEIGPGYGATTRVLVEMAPKVTAVEVDARSAEDLRGEFDGRARILHGDGSKMSLPDNDFSSVVCFTMLHHVPTRDMQDGIFAEALRVLRPGGVFAGSDSRLSLRFRMLHIGDTMNVVDPDELPERLRRAGFEDVEVTLKEGAFKFKARKPSR